MLRRHAHQIRCVFDARRCAPELRRLHRFVRPHLRVLDVDDQREARRLPSQRHRREERRVIARVRRAAQVQKILEASIADIDPGNKHPEVYFASYSGGAHCCTHVVIAEEQGAKWVAVTVGDFDGDGRYLDDLDHDGVAEVVTVDNRFLYQFDCYACSSAPLQIYTVRDGKSVDVTTD